MGAWYLLHLERDPAPLKVVCVIAIKGHLVTLECPSHLLSDAEVMDIDTLFIGPVWYFGGKAERFRNYFSPKFLGYGKPRWFWGRVRRMTNLFGTLYTRP